MPGASLLQEAPPSRLCPMLRAYLKLPHSSTGYITMDRLLFSTYQEHVFHFYTILCWISFTLTHLELFFSFATPPLVVLEFILEESIRMGYHSSLYSLFRRCSHRTISCMLQHMFIVLWTEHWGHCTDSDGSYVCPHAATAADAPWGKQWEETLVRQLPLPAQPPAEVS